MNANESAVFSIKDATNTEIYNAIDGSVWFKESDIERLAVAVESQDLAEVGRLYVAMLETNVLLERARILLRGRKGKETPKTTTQYELTEAGEKFICDDNVCRKAGVGA